jgi:hypothetical protein
VQVLYYLGEELWPGCRIAKAIAGSIERADTRVLRDHGLGFVPDHRPAEYSSHQDNRRCAGACTMHVDTPAADVDLPAWLGVRQYPLVLGHRGHLGKSGFANQK